MSKQKYIYTNHFWKRFRERFVLKTYWENKDKDKDKDKDKEVNNILKDSTEDKSYLNNTTFMFYLQDLYGYDCKYKFMSNADHNILFVTILDKGKRIVKTCYPLTTSRFIFRKKFKKKDKKKICMARSRKKRILFNEFDAVKDHLENN